MGGTDLLQGTLDMMILKALALEPLHGYAVARRIAQMSGEVLTVEEGSLYPALYRLEDRKLIAAQWGTSENNRRAKYYRLTKAGRKELDAATQNWARLALAVSRLEPRMRARGRHRRRAAVPPREPELAGFGLTRCWHGRRMSWRPKRTLLQVNPSHLACSPAFPPPSATPSASSGCRPSSRARRC